MTNARTFPPESIVTSPLAGGPAPCYVCGGSPCWGDDHLVLCRDCWAAHDEEMSAAWERIRERRVSKPKEKT
jgi:hypothetical protein